MMNIPPTDPPEEPPGRRRPAHFPTVEAFNRTTAVFVTVCTHQRRALLARPEIHALLRAVWTEIAEWQVGHYVLMLDHLHFLCVPASPESPALARWVKYWKSVATRRWPHMAEKPPWQLDFWDTQLRRGDHYAAKWEYIRHNPVRHDHVARAEDWPLQGKVFDLRWHDAP